MSSDLTHAYPPGYVPARIDDAWLAALTSATSWRAALPAPPAPVPLRDLPTGPLADAGTAPLFDVEHEQTAWFYRVTDHVSAAHLHPGPMTDEQYWWFGSERAVMYTHEKRAIAHRGELLRVWPQHSDVDGAYGIVCAPTAVTRGQLADGPIIDLVSTDLGAAVRDTIVTSARMNTTVVLARTVARMYLDR